MTTVYGVTFVGARAQIEKQLRDLPGFPQEKAWGAASYLAKLVCFELCQSSKSPINYVLYRLLLQSETRSKGLNIFNYGSTSVHVSSPSPSQKTASACPETPKVKRLSVFQKLQSRRNK